MQFAALSRHRMVETRRTRVDEKPCVCCVCVYMLAGWPSVRVCFSAAAVVHVASKPAETAAYQTWKKTRTDHGPKVSCMKLLDRDWCECFLYDCCTAAAAATCFCTTCTTATTAASDAECGFGLTTYGLRPALTVCVYDLRLAVCLLR